MQIFITSIDPTDCAIALDDRRLNKMITETCQIMCGALYLNGANCKDNPLKSKHPEIELPFKISHLNHPCVKWASLNSANFGWLYLLLYELNKEWLYRGFNPHLSFTKCYDVFNKLWDILPEGEMTPFPNVSFFKNDSNIFLAYQKTLIEKWEKENAKWTKRSNPEWYFKNKEINNQIG
jgi:hypothetical protein